MTLEPFDRFQRALDWATKLAANQAANQVHAAAAASSDQPEQAANQAAIKHPIVLPPAPQPPAPVRYGPSFIRLSDVAPTTAITVRCGGRLINREVTIVVGDGGVGKGLFGVWLAAHITNGWQLPDEEGTYPPLHVCVITFEDSIPIWRQRFNAAGGNEDALIIFRIEDLSFNINELHTLEQKWGLVIIDPALLLCSAEGISPNDNRRVREMLQRLQRVAQRLDCPVLIIHHPNSRGNILGGPTWRNAVRSVLELGEQADKSLGLLHTKHNNVQKQAPLWFQLNSKIHNSENVGVLEYIGANENLKPYVKPKPKAGDDDGSAKITEQVAWMIETLASNNGDMARPALLKAWTEKTGLSDRTLRTVISLAVKMDRIVLVTVRPPGSPAPQYRVKFKAVHEQDQVIDVFMGNVDEELNKLIGEDT